MNVHCHGDNGDGYDGDDGDEGEDSFFIIIWPETKKKDEVDLICFSHSDRTFL